MRRLIFILLALVVVSPVMGSKSALALSVSPLVYTYEVQPGDQVAGTITLTNETSERLTYTPNVEDFVATGDETGTPKFVAAGTASKTSLASWVSFSTASISLEPTEQRHLSFTVTVPTDAAAGGYYGGLLFTSGGQITQKVGVLLLIAVAGDVYEAAELISFEGPSTIVSHLPVTFTARIKNNGDIFLQPIGIVQISNMLGGESTTLLVNRDAGNILPSSIRRFETTWQAEEVADEAPEIVKEWKNFGLGRYTANLAVQYGSNEETLNATVSFWVIPWQLLTVAALILLVLTLLTHLKHKQK